jgi:hypothetical protein
MAEELAEKVGVATEAFAAAKAGRSFCSLSGTTEVMPCYKAPLKRAFRQSVKSCPVSKPFDTSRHRWIALDGQFVRLWLKRSLLFDRLFQVLLEVRKHSLV